MWISISHELTSDQLMQVFKEYFPQKEIWIGKDIPSGGPYDIYCTLEEIKGEFPLTVFFWWGLGEDKVAYEECIKIAKILASTYDCTAICDGSIHGGGPMYDILFRDGKSYLAYDEDDMTVCGFDNGRGIVIIKEITL